MYVWKDLDLDCKHCGKPLQARRCESYGFVILGLEPVEFRHWNGELECTQINPAEPYDYGKARQYLR